MNKLFSIRDCGRLIGIAPHKIAYAHSQDRLAEPKLRFAGKRVYTWQDCRRVAKHFGVEIADRPEVPGDM
jgi:2-hydroxychromene-2-carboxylate isomerase